MEASRRQGFRNLTTILLYYYIATLLYYCTTIVLHSHVTILPYYYIPMSMLPCYDITRLQDNAGCQDLISGCFRGVGVLKVEPG